MVDPKTGGRFDPLQQALHVGFQHGLAGPDRRESQRGIAPQIVVAHLGARHLEVAMGFVEDRANEAALLLQRGTTFEA